MNANERKSKILLFAFICVCSRALLGADDAATLEQELKKLAAVYATVESESADPIPAETAFYQGAIPGMTKSSW